MRCAVCWRPAVWWDGARALCCDHAAAVAARGCGVLVPVEAAVAQTFVRHERGAA